MCQRQRQSQKKDNVDDNDANNDDNDNPGSPAHNDADEPESDLGLEDEDVLNESLDSPRHYALRRWLVNTALKITSEKQRLREET